MGKVQTLDLELFTKIQEDLETRQYQILDTLKKIKNRFRRNKIYPELAELVEIYNTLIQIKKRIADAREEFPKRIKNIDLINKVIEHEVVLLDGASIEQVENLITWAEPHIEQVIEEGASVYEFVDDRIEIEQVGIVPNYQDEGYLFVPDNEKRKLNLFEYEVSLFESAKAKYRALKTQFIKNLDWGFIVQSPNSIKLHLIAEYKKLPNPATYSIQTDLEFPFDETIFPVVKHKLMRRLYN